jgi:hypothetical protein
MFFIIDPPGSDLVLDMTLKPYLVQGKLEKQQVTVSVNGYKLETLTIDKHETRDYRVTIPSKTLSGSQLAIVFDIPTATAPVDLGIGTDVRTLGVSFKSIRISRTVQ